MQYETLLVEREEETRVLALGREITELASLLERLEGEKREAEHQAMTSRHMLQQLESLRLRRTRLTGRRAVARAHFARQ